MQPSFLLAQLFAEGSLARSAYNALPDSPVQPTVARRRLRFGRRQQPTSGRG